MDKTIPAASSTDFANVHWMKATSLLAWMMVHAMMPSLYVATRRLCLLRCDCDQMPM